MDMNDSYITVCPLCEGAIQATEIWHVYKNVHKVAVKKGHNGGIWFDIVDDEPGYNEDEFLNESRIYCENDHIEHEMLSAVSLSMRENK